MNSDEPNHVFLNQSTNYKHKQPSKKRKHPEESAKEILPSFPP